MDIVVQKEKNYKNSIMNELLEAYKYRIYPTSDQQDKLNRTFGCVQVVRKRLVENYNLHGSLAFNPKMSKNTVEEDGRFHWIEEVSAALQQRCMDFFEAKSQFLNKKHKTKLGRMSFKRKQGRQSYQLPNQKFKLDQENFLFRLEKIGHVSLVIGRRVPLDTDCRSVTVSKTPAGKFFVSILVKTNVDLLPITGSSVGIDLGLKDLFIFSNGDVVNNPRWHCKRYEKQRIKVARVHEKIANQRKHSAYSISAVLVREFDVISVEDLNVSGMKMGDLGKSISDASWSEFVRQLDYRSRWYGKSFVKIDRFYPSGQVCSSCGYRDVKKALDVRWQSCSSCSVEHNRDSNAAANVLIKGYSYLTAVSFNETSTESVNHRRGEYTRLVDKIDRHLATTPTRLDKYVDLS